MRNKLLCIIGALIVTDAYYSISLYMNAPSYEGSRKQTWKRDHWVRVTRGFLGLAIVIFGLKGRD